jgi:hypothetical protein
MAIKISNTTVINDSRGLENITNLKTVNGNNILGTGDILAGVTVYEYENRGQLRTATPTQGAQALVRGVGLFIWVSGDTSLDDDETCFATASGRWLLEAIGWDFVDSQLPYVPKVLTQTFPNTITSINANTSVSFVVTLMGLTAGTPVTVNFLGTLPARGTITAYSVINNQVTVVVSNTSETSSITIPTGNWVVSALV